MEPALEDLAGALSRLPEIRLAYLFGSRASGRANRESDYDVAVLVDERLSLSDRRTWWNELGRVTGALASELPSDRVDVAFLNEAGPLLRHRVLRDGILLYAASEEERVRFATRAIREYRDFEVRRAWFTERRVERLRRGPPDGRQGDLLEEARRARRILGGPPGVP